MPTRRDFLASSLAALAVGRAAPAAELLPARTLTKGPKFHWFGYYDKLEFDPANQRVLGMAVDFEHRQPTADDAIAIGFVDLADGDRWHDLGTSRAWSWQQGCMLQWRPGSRSEVIWNDRGDDRYVSHRLDTATGQRRTIPWPIYALSPDGRSAVTVDFRRLNDTRPGYGYVGLTDPHRDELAPKDSGIWSVDLDSGKANLILSLAEVARFERPEGEDRGAKHWFNHLLYFYCVSWQSSHNLGGGKRLCRRQWQALASSFRCNRRVT
jgi:hypothetical protein